MLKKLTKIHGPALIILVLSIVAGLLVYRDYGISWDEQSQHNIGLKSYGYMFEGDKSYETFFYKEYGVAFEVPLIMIEKALSLTDTRDIYLMRHLVTHLFFLLAAYVFYLLAWSLTRNRLAAMAGYLMLLLMPRIYAHSFFNTKDIPFMSMFIICFYFTWLAFSKRKMGYFLLSAVFCGLLINIRVMGILVPVITILFLLTDLILQKRLANTLLTLILFVAVTAGTLILTWPFLWKDPVGNFLVAFASMSKYRWDNYILMFGHFVRSTKIGWWYFPSWFAITTPVIYIVAGITGFLLLAWNIIKNPVRFLTRDPERQQLLFLACFVAPVIAVIVLHSVMYDAWRQLYFVYPSLVLLAVYGLSHLTYKLAGKGSLATILITVILAGAFADAAVFMVKSHPFQDVYFNRLVSRKEQYLRKNFEMNYWGTGYRQALEKILREDPAPVIRVMPANMPGELNLMLFPEKDRKRVCYVYSLAKADYFITNYRWHPGDYPYLPARQYFTARVLNSDIISAWKLK